jgi:outer membrane lipoprotein
LEIRNPVAGAPKLEAVATDAAPYQGQYVRWGGTVASVENKANETWLEIVAKRLDAFGEPKYEDKTEGRFLARYEGFLDPKIYGADRQVTVYGVIEPSEPGKIGEQPYIYPVVKAEKVYLWPQRVSWRDDPWCRDYYWHSPFYYPYPYRYSPFWRHYWLGYPYYWGDPFWGPFGYPGYCRP